VVLDVARRAASALEDDAGGKAMTRSERNARRHFEALVAHPYADEIESFLFGCGYSRPWTRAGVDLMHLANELASARAAARRRA
jgi:hypothetical protein